MRKMARLLVVILLVLFVSETKAGLVDVLDAFRTPSVISITTVQGQNNFFYFSPLPGYDIFGLERDLTFYYDSDVDGRTINLSIENGVFFVETSPGVNLRLQVDYDGQDGYPSVDGYGLDGFNFGSSSTAVSVKAKVSNNVGFDLLPQEIYYPPFYNMSTTFTNDGTTQTFTVPFDTMGGTWYQIGAISFDIRIPPDTKAYFRDFATFKPQINGKVFVDLNRNGRRDAGEAGYSRQVIKATDLSSMAETTTYSSALGAFELYVNPGDYLICVNDTQLVPTVPTSGCQTVRLVPDRDVTNVLLGYEPQKVSVQVSGTSVLAESSSTSFVITVTRDIPCDAELTVYLTLSGTAMRYIPSDKKRNGDGDYYMSNQFLNNDKFKAVIYGGYSSSSFLLDVIADGLIEGTEDIIVTLSSSGFYQVVGIPFVTLQITDSPQLSISAFPLGFQQSLRKTFTFTLSLTFALDHDITFGVRRGGSATYGLEYTLSLPFEPSGEYSLTFPAGSTSYSFTAIPSATPISSPDVSIAMEVIDPEGSAEYSPSPYQDRVYVYICRDDFKVQVTNDYLPAIAESTQQSTYFVFSRPSAVCPVLIDFTISGTATFGTDYYISSFFGTFTPGRNTVQLSYDYDASFSIIAMPDALVEPDETVIITINPNPYYVIDPSFASATVTILDS